MKTIRVISRAIAVMKALDRQPGQTLAALTQATQMPKASLLRVLASLEAEGMVWRAMGDGLYRSRVTVTRLSDTHIRHHRLAELSAPVLRRLQQSLVWPSDLAVRTGYCMELVETSRPVSPLSIVRESLGFSVDMTLSAVGRAYLAFCSPAEYEEIVKHLCAHPEDCIAAQRVSAAQVERIAEETRRQGFGKRDSRFGGRGNPIREFDDGLAAIAVPIMTGPELVAGCLSMVWLKRFDIARDVARTRLPLLRQAAEEIAAAIVPEPPKP